MTAAIARILLVEDESLVAVYSQHVLEQAGYAVVGWASSGEKAVVLAAELQPDLVLMDIHLAAKMDGITAAKQIRAQQAVPIVFLSSSDSHETLQRAHAASPYGYLLKPCQPDVLCRTIQQALDQQTPGRSVIRPTGPQRAGSEKR
jgi:DNA-binding NarL/FixJ family response regulator